MSTKRNVMYKCPFCDKRFNRADLVNHVEEDHPYEIPKDFTAFRYVFNYVNKKPVTYHGKCTECGGSTPWDENKGRYNRQCGKKACHDSFIRKFEENMVKTTGVTRLSSTAEGQIKLLAGRKISGEYKFKNGDIKTYTGSYELKALEFMDRVMNIDPDDLMCPGPIFEYIMNGKKYIYITDFYYQPYNLIIEVKDGGDNPNKRNMPEYRQKQIAKEKYIIQNTNYNYLRLTNNNLNQLLAVFMDLKMQMVENTGERVIHVNESVEEVNPINEYMNALMSGKVVGMRDSDAYIINYQQNNVYNDNKLENKFCLTNNLTDKTTGICIPLDSGTLEKNSIINLGKLKEPKYNTRIYKSPLSIQELSELFAPYIGKKVDDSFIYETIMKKKLYTTDQILFDNLQDITEEVLYVEENINSIVESYIIGEDSFEKEMLSVIESVNEVISNG